MAGPKGYGRPRERYVGPDGTECTSCREILPYDAFTPGNVSTCKRCKYFHHTGRKYGLSRLAYEAMMQAQNHVCAICQRRPAKYVDHDHRTGEVRGILCQPCNNALGAFYDDEGVLLRAAQYVGGEI